MASRVLYPPLLPSPAVDLTDRKGKGKATENDLENEALRAQFKRFQESEKNQFSAPKQEPRSSSAQPLTSGGKPKLPSILRAPNLPKSHGGSGGFRKPNLFPDLHRGPAARHTSPPGSHNPTRHSQKSDPGVTITKAEYEHLKRLASAPPMPEPPHSSPRSNSPSVARETRRRSRESSRAPSMGSEDSVTPDMLKLATILGMVLKNSNLGQDRSRRSPLIKISEPLDNGYTGPSFAIWRSQVERALRINDDHHRGVSREESRRHIVESNVIGVAANFIAQGLETGQWDNHTAEDLIENLAELCYDPVRAERYYCRCPSATSTACPPG
jgi:hypothetical protein